MRNLLAVNLTTCKRFRTRSDGTIIYLLNCPACLTRVGKTDTKYKLGVAILDKQIKWSKCLRCGYSPNVSVTGYHAQPNKPKRLPLEGTGATRIAYTGRLADSPIVALIEQHRRSCGIWRGLTAADLAQAGAEVDDRADRIYLPYLSSTREKGWVIRTIPWEGERGEGREGYMGEGEQKRMISINLPPFKRRAHRPKVLTDGPNGPVCLPYTYGDIPVIVEGVADGIAIPPPYIPIVLLGTGNWMKIPCNQHYILALDGDTSGRSTARALVRALLKANCKVKVVCLPAKEDPASLGRDTMKKMLEGALDVPSLAVMLSLLGETVCQNQ